jgi:transposase-like protein
MPAKKPPTGTDRDLNLATLLPIFSDEEKAREFFESKRWPNGPVCPHCESVNVSKLTARPKSKSPVRPGVYQCNDCREQFTVRVGSIMEESKLPLSKWAMAYHLLTSSKKGMSSHQIAREVGCTQKTAWFLCHRIREAMKSGGPNGDGKLNGEVEVDESYIGGKPRHANNPGGKPKKVHKRGRGTDKTPVMVLVERDGTSRAMPVEFVDADTLKQAVRENVDPSATIITDEFASYKGLGDEFDGGHHTVNHSAKEYVRHSKKGKGPKIVSTNTAESWFALLKRSHYGIHHKMSKKHLHRYCVERSFVWNHREVTDGERMIAAMERAEGKRLMYASPNTQAG